MTLNLSSKSYRALLTILLGATLILCKTFAEQDDVILGLGMISAITVGFLRQRALKEEGKSYSYLAMIFVSVVLLAVFISSILIS